MFCQNADGEPIDVKVKSKGDSVYSCSYTPTSAIKHTVAVTWDGINVPNSPFRVSPSEPQGSAVPSPTSTSTTNLSPEIAYLTLTKNTVPEVNAYPNTNLIPVVSDLIDLDGPAEPCLSKRKPLIIVITYFTESRFVSIL